MTSLKNEIDNQPDTTASHEGEQFKADEEKGKGVLTLRSSTVRTLDEALEVCQADLTEWEVERWIANKWDCVAKRDVDPHGEEPELAATELWQIKVWFARKTPVVLGLESIIERLQANSPVTPPIPRRLYHESVSERALEICIMDPHLGLQCERPHSDHSWSLDECCEFFTWAIDGLLKRAEPYGPFTEVLWIFGNDYLHHDNVHHTTTQGTPQPEGVAWHTAYQRGVELAIATGDELKQVAPLRILQIPGNHDRQSSYTLGWVLWAYYHNDPNVTVECSPEPYRFWRWGKNLLGFDHRGMKQERLAALMANECSGPGPRQGWWDETSYREWHLGDQHRKGGGRPVAMTEQGVGVEFLTGLTPANEWHKLKSFNWQTRGAVAYVWDKATGPEARLHVNIDSYTGKPMGEE